VFGVPAIVDEAGAMTPVEPGLADKVTAISGVFGEADIPFAFGGALALAYYAEPRATIDIDVNVFVAPEDIDRVVRALDPFDIDADATQRRTARRDGQVRLWWGITPVDIFLAYDKFHFHAAERVRMVPFGPDTIPVLAAEDLLICKVVFDRRKDWIDIDQMLLLTAGSLDLDDVRSWVTRIVGGDDPRLARLEQSIESVLGSGGGASYSA